jgi:hypothetical protein
LYDDDGDGDDVGDGDGDGDGDGFGDACSNYIKNMNIHDYYSELRVSLS